MEKHFVTYELAVKLKELGFKRTCLVEYIDGIFYLSTSLNNKKQVSTTASAPLWEQAFGWFREKQNIVGSVDGGCEQNFFFFSTTKLGEESFFSADFKSYEEARQACLEKLIEIVTENK